MPIKPPADLPDDPIAAYRRGYDDARKRNATGRADFAKAGAVARNAALSPERRSEIARNAALKRHSKKSAK